MEFKPDDNKQDFRGRFIYREGYRQMTEGFFTVNPSQETIDFQWDEDKDLVYQYKFSTSLDDLTFNFSEDGYDFFQVWTTVD